METPPESVIYREEVVGILFGIADLNEKLARVVELLEGEIGGGEGFSEDDS